MSLRGQAALCALDGWVKRGRHDADAGQSLDRYSVAKPSSWCDSPSAGWMKVWPGLRSGSTPGAVTNGGGYAAQPAHGQRTMVRSGTEFHWNLGPKWTP